MATRSYGERDHQIPPKASIRLGPTTDEEVFGEAFNGQVVGRFIKYVAVYRNLLWVAIAAVLVFTVSSIAFPLIVKIVYDDALAAGAPDRSKLATMVIAFLIAVGFNFLANYLQELIVGRVAERILFDMRRAMYLHIQRISLSFMDKTEVGRLMSRLQGDVSTIKVLLETSVFAIGDFVLLTGIIIVLLTLD